MPVGLSAGFSFLSVGCQMLVPRLGPADAVEIVSCFRRVYGDSYANELFYDPEALGAAMAAGRIGSVGAATAEGRILGHMAMTVHEGAGVVELGNTVVDPVARGAGLAWKVAAELSAWCRELGYQGFLHYPTTDHHIMQRRSVEAGIETGLMLGYIPEETRGRMQARGEGDAEAAVRRRQAATIVYEPFGPGASFNGFVPAVYADLVQRLTQGTGLPRRWREARGTPGSAADVLLSVHEKRRLHRCSVTHIGTDLEGLLSDFGNRGAPCLQLDLPMADPGIGYATQIARGLGFGFCGWLPGYGKGDVLRLQKVDPLQTDLSPALENPGAREILQRFLAEVR